VSLRHRIERLEARIQPRCVLCEVPEKLAKALVERAGQTGAIGHLCPSCGRALGFEAFVLADRLRSEARSASAERHGPPGLSISREPGEGVHDTQFEPGDSDALPVVGEG
jgi:hypothetical protein